ncbi:MAG: hypothetical protein MAG794_00268 [Gammaproteobacteria bacterium]|nr:hypothetical protein [Gammaproteobacteria bacterium]
MSEGDLEQVVALDATAGGFSRNDFFRRRRRAMAADPRSYIGLIAVRAEVVNGFVLGHILTGEFGTHRRLAIIDSIAVSPGRRGSGVGGALMKALKATARERGCAEVRTLAEWERQDLIGFFASTGFTPAPVNVLEKSLGGY